MMPASLAEIERIYRDRYPQLLRVATALAGDVEHGRDAVHEAFVQAIRARASLRRDASVEAWIWRIVTNSATAVRRREARGGGTLREAPAGEQTRDPDGLRAVVAALPERQRAALFLRYYADLDYDAIAEALGIRRGTVAATLHAAHAALKTSLMEAPL
jgi:RNA polymerase sigma factor (sigma-70 family)